MKQFTPIIDLCVYIKYEVLQIQVWQLYSDNWLFHVFQFYFISELIFSHFRDGRTDILVHWNWTQNIGLIFCAPITIYLSSAKKERKKEMPPTTEKAKESIELFFYSFVFSHLKSFVTSNKKLNSHPTVKKTVSVFNGLIRTRPLPTFFVIKFLEK